jgi:hypothetical protein
MPTRALSMELYQASNHPRYSCNSILSWLFILLSFIVHFKVVLPFCIFLLPCSFFLVQLVVFEATMKGLPCGSGYLHSWVWRFLNTHEMHLDCSNFPCKYIFAWAQLNFISRSAETEMQAKKKCTCLKQIQNTSYCCAELNWFWH